LIRLLPCPASGEDVTVALKFVAPVSDITPMSLLSITDRHLPRSRPQGAAARSRASSTGRRSTLGPNSASPGLDASPPSLRHAPDSAWQRFMFWLMAPAPQEAAPPLNRLPAVREDFLDAVADLPGAHAHALRHRITHAHSLRDLWHLRADVFSLVGQQHSQRQAEHRLLRLNRHFPMRAGRSQFGVL
jgi:hypothetical protein